MPVTGGRAIVLLTTLLLLLPGAAHGQDAAERVAMGDRAQAAGDAVDALAHYEAALATDSAHYEALWKASREAMDVGEYAEGAAQREALFAKAEGYARRAVRANPDHAEGHFALARALGRAALSAGARERVRYAVDVRTHALAALEADPDHTGALHVMGVWNAEVMRLSSLQRFLARNLLGARVFERASWSEAARYLERAVQLNPRRIVHRLDLARVYADMGNRERAREELEWVRDAAPADFNDAHYKREAEQLLRSLR